MRTIKKLTAVIMAFAMVLCLMASGVEAAATSPYTTKTFKNAKRYTFMHNAGDEKDYKSVIYYTDDYFTLDPTASSPNISFVTASYALCLAAMGSNDKASYAESDQNLKNLLKKIGFKNYKSNHDFKIKPTSNTLGVGAACKKINGQTVLAVGLRGAGYEREWIGNTSMGRYGEHNNYALCSDNTLDFLKKYIKDNKIKGNIKIWMVGYSRGGAVGNLVAAAIDDGALKDTGVKVGAKDLYAMFYEPPQGADATKDLQNKRYNNIWSFANLYDAVPLIGMKEFGFGRYGRVWNYPSRNTTSNYASKRKAMEKLFYAQTSHEVEGDYTADDFQMYKLDLANGIIAEDTKNKKNLEEFTPELLHFFATTIVGSRENFVNEFQNVSMIGLTLYSGRGLQSGTESFEGFLNALQKNLKQESVMQRLARAAAKPYDPTYGFNTVVKDLLVESVNDAGFTSLDPVSLGEFLPVAAKVLTALLVFEPDMAVTAIMNIQKIINVHYPEVSFAWLMTMDPNYNGVKDCY